jgi:hypothetical protein
MEMKNRLLKSLVLGLGVMGVVWACQPPDELPIIPKISYNRVEFFDQPTGSDSLILYINFEDGDGDIGLRSTEDSYPYHPFNYIIDAERRLVYFGETDYKLPFYSVPLVLSGGQFRPLEKEKLFSETDTRRPFNCEQYEVIKFNLDNTGTNTEIDTFFIQKNPNNNNIYVDFYRKVNGNYEFLDWANVFSSTGCGTNFNARFPIFDTDNLGKSLSGTLRYSMLSAGFGIVLKKDTFKLKVYIKDRALHDSNVIESPDLTLDNITLK